MDTNLRRAAVAVALISGLAGRLLAVAPVQQSTFEVSTLARVNRAEAASPVITALNLSDPDGYAASPLRDTPTPKSGIPGPAAKPNTTLIPTGSSGIAEVIAANAKLGEPLEAGCE